MASGRAPREAGVRLIIAYKVIKAIAQVALAVALPILTREGATAWLAGRTTALATHAAHHWTATLARALAALLTGNQLRLVALALGFDGVFSAFEGWSLHRGFRWAPWLVGIAAGTLIPFEIAELARRPRAGRAVVLAVNVAIVGYLLWRARRRSPRKLE